MSQKRKSRKGSASAQEKGRLAETIVAKMHDSPGVRVETRKKLPVKGASGLNGRTSMIDILLITANVVGYPVHIAVKCKTIKIELKKRERSATSSSFWFDLTHLYSRKGTVTETLTENQAR